VKHQPIHDESEWQACIRGATALGIPLDRTTEELLHRYTAFIRQRSPLLHLVSPNDTGRIPTRHVLDSLLPLHLIPEKARVFDLGSGAGFPGLPISILRRDIHMTLIESNLKKSVFLREAVTLLGLDHVTVCRERAENLHTTLLHRFDIGLVRAVARLENLWKWGMPLLRPAGRLICYKGPGYEEELKTLEKKICFIEDKKRIDTANPTPQQQTDTVSIHRFQLDPLPLSTILIELAQST